MRENPRGGPAGREAVVAVGHVSPHSGTGKCASSPGHLSNTLRVLHLSLLRHPPAPRNPLSDSEFVGDGRQERARSPRCRHNADSGTLAPALRPPAPPRQAGLSEPSAAGWWYCLS